MFIQSLVKHPYRAGLLRQRTMHLPLLSALFLPVLATSSYGAVSSAASKGVASQGVLTVNTTADSYDGACSATDCSLREAITLANRARAPRTIQFHISSKDKGFAKGVFTIQLKKSLPSIINDKTTIDGFSQTAFGGDTNKTGPEVALSGPSSSTQGAGLQDSGLWIRAAKCVVQGLAINGFRYAGVAFSGKDCAYNIVRGCDLGVGGANYAGVLIAYGSHDNVIGGTTSRDRNLISNNTVDVGIGVSIKDDGCYGNRIVGNFVGVDRTGTGLLFGGVDSYGIFVFGHDNAIGGSQAGAGNVVAGEMAIEIFGATANGNKVQGNFVGVDATGKKALPGTVFGIYVQDGNGNLIGGEQAGARNVVGGCQKVAIGVQHNRESNAPNAGSRNVIQGNFVGTDKTGTVALPNECNAVQLIGASYTRVGGTRPGARNILASSKAGVGIFDNIAEANPYHGVGNIVQGNYIGTDVTGKKALPNAENGITISNAEGSIIGGTQPGAGNLISGNAGSGIYQLVDDATFARFPNAQATYISGNTIGTDVTGTVALGNRADGILIQGAVGTIIGGNGGRARNLISGNVGNGVTVDNYSVFVATVQQARGVRVRGNYIGTDIKGDKAIGNGASGILIEGATETVVGGREAEGNLISGNTTTGITIVYDQTYTASGQELKPATRNLVVHNIIGTDATGDKAVPNGDCGIIINRSSDNIVGGATSGSGNLISGNSASGVLIVGEGATHNEVLGNSIGTNADGTAPIGNSAGIAFIYGASHNIIGGTSGEAGNDIGGNKGVGVIVFDESKSNTIRGNSIHDNFGADGNNAGIFLSPTTENNAFVPNDDKDGDDGPNRLQNYPILTNVVTSEGSNPTTRLTGTLNSTPNKSFVVDFYANPSMVPGTLPEGQIYSGSVTVKTDAEGNANFAFTARGGRVGVTYTAMATDLETGDSSEFSDGEDSSAQATANSPAATVPSGGSS